MDGKVINKVFVSQYYYNLLSQNIGKVIKANISQESYLDECWLLIDDTWISGNKHLLTHVFCKCNGAKQSEIDALAVHTHWSKWYPRQLTEFVKWRPHIQVIPSLPHSMYNLRYFIHGCQLGKLVFQHSPQWPCLFYERVSTVDTMDTIILWGSTTIVYVLL